MVPYRCRGLAMLIVMTWSVGIGAYSVTAKWHRLSDTIGADFVALIVGSIAALVLLRYGAIQRTEYRPKLRVIYVVLMSIGGFMALAVALLWDISLECKICVIRSSNGIYTWRQIA